MKYLIVLLFFVLSSIISGCLESSSSDHAQGVENQTPEVLEEKSTVSSRMGDISKWSRSDIIQALYEEAVSENAELQQITDRIHAMNEAKSDSLESHYKYFQNNDEYWHAVTGYIAQISDSVLREETSKIFLSLQADYRQTIQSNDAAFASLNEISQKLNNNEILMKLVVTQQMMRRYQQNELPSVETLKKLQQDYQELLEDMQPYIEVNN